jgi:hypothetical protein
MSFLTPLFLLGATAIALPILFHLIRRSAKEKLTFSSLMFLTPSPPRVTKRSRLEHILLLIARCLILMLLAAAFARPFIRKPVPVTPQDTPARRVVILVDTSASMRRGNLWPLARSKAEGHLRTISAQDKVAVLAFSSEVQPLISWDEATQMTPAERTSTAIARLNAVEPGWRGTDLGRAVLRAAELLVDSSNKDLQQQQTARGEIIVVSDMQAGARLEGLQGYEWPKSITVTVDSLKLEERSNASMQVLGETARKIGGTNASLRLRVQNTPGSKKEQFEVAWARDGQPISDKLTVYVPPGQARLAAAPLLPPGATPSELLLLGDTEPFDNRTFYVSGERTSAAVLYLGKDAESDPQGLLFYLKRGLETSTAGAVRVITSSDAGAEASSMAIVSGAVSSSELQLLRQLLDAGKTVLVTGRDSSAVETLKQLTTNLRLQSTEAPAKGYTLLGEINFNHALFAPFADAKFSDFTKVNFWKYRQLELAGMTNAVVAAKFDTGAPAVVEFPSGKGRIYYLASTWAPADSQLALSSKFIPLLLIMLEQGTELYHMTPQYIVGQAVNLPAEMKRLTGPGKIEVRAGQTSFVPLEPGVYSVDGQPAFAVNLDPAESRIAPLGIDQLQALGVPLKSPEKIAVTSKAKIREQQLLDTEVESRQKLWRALMLGAMAFILLETMLAMRASTRFAAAQSAAS